VLFVEFLRGEIAERAVPAARIAEVLDVVGHGSCAYSLAALGLCSQSLAAVGFSGRSLTVASERGNNGLFVGVQFAESERDPST
jgi:hypothetical protein